MMKTSIHNITLLLSLLLTLAAAALSHEGKIPVIIDTDCALDDLRAICLLLADDRIEALAVTTSDGALPPQEGLVKARALLASLGFNEVLAATGGELDAPPPPWREFNRKIPWGEEIPTEMTGTPTAAALITEILGTEQDPVTIIVLGSMTNLADALKRRIGLSREIERVIWYNQAFNPPAGTNYLRDRESADFILETGLKVDILSSAEVPEARFDEALRRRIETIDTQAARAIAQAHRCPEAMQRIENGHLRLWDDLTALHLLHPGLFQMETLPGKPTVSVNLEFDPEAVKEEMVEILEGEDRHHNVLFHDFPTDSALFEEDVRPVIAEIIARHGEEEWRLCVLASEFHRHLGIYSMTGVKMGLKARELFNVGPDELIVVSFAGLEPPVSCMNDGLQVGAGATLGHGSITVIEGENPLLAAEFSHNGKTLRLNLKPEFRERVRLDILKGIEEHGNLTPEYFDFIRQTALKYWKEWSRDQIFSVEAVE